MADEENTVNTVTQFDHRDSSEIEEHGTKARMTVNKWKKRKELGQVRKTTVYLTQW